RPEPSCQEDGTRDAVEVFWAGRGPSGVPSLRRRRTKGIRQIGGPSQNVGQLLRRGGSQTWLVTRQKYMLELRSQPAEHAGDVFVVGYSENEQPAAGRER